MRRVHQDHLVELVNTVLHTYKLVSCCSGQERWRERREGEKGKQTDLVDPVRVENSETSTSSRNSLLGGRSERSLELEVVDTLVRGFTESGSLRDGSLSVSSSNSDSVDHETLLGLARRSGESATILEKRNLLICRNCVETASRMMWRALSTVYRVVESSLSEELGKGECDGVEYCVEE